MNLSNTPLRSGKTSLSPLRIRKAETNNVINYANSNVRNTKRKNQTEEREP